MNAVVVDASVWVSAIDRVDVHHVASRAFLSALAARQIKIVLPAIARLEVACALSRIFRNPARGRQLSEAYLRSPLVEEIAIGAALIASAIDEGTEKRLRSGDALYVAVALQTGARLVAWDTELIERAGATSPQAWLEENPG